MDECGKCCSKVSDEEKSISCDSCHIPFHLRDKCSNLSPSEIKAVVIQKCVLLFFCDQCRTAFKNVPMLIRKIDNLNTEVEKLKKEVDELKTQSNFRISPEEVLAETEERIVRSSNVIIYNVKESLAESVAQRIVDDKEVITKILRETGVTVEINKVVRIGKKQPDNHNNKKNRPIKVVLSNPKIAKEILKNKNKLSTSGYRVANDFTVNQMKYMSDLRNKLAERVAKGENLTIRYINGIPRIAAPVSKK